MESKPRTQLLSRIRFIRKMRMNAHKLRVHQGFTLIELMIVVAIIGILASIAIPRYQEYVFRTQVHRVVAEAGSLKAAIEHCLVEGRTAVGDPAIFGNCDPQATSSNLQATGGNAAPTTASSVVTGSGVPQVSLSSTAPSTIVATFGNTAGGPLQGAPAGAITWRRNLDGTWDCRTVNIEAKYVSPTCPL